MGPNLIPGPDNNFMQIDLLFTLSPIYSPCNMDRLENIVFIPFSDDENEAPPYDQYHLSSTTIFCKSHWFHG